MSNSDSLQSSHSSSSHECPNTPEYYWYMACSMLDAAIEKYCEACRVTSQYHYDMLMNKAYLWEQESWMYLFLYEMALESLESLDQE